MGVREEPGLEPYISRCEQANTSCIMSAYFGNRHRNETDMLEGAPVKLANKIEKHGKRQGKAIGLIGIDDLGYRNRRKAENNQTTKQEYKYTDTGTRGNYKTNNRNAF